MKSSVKTFEKNGYVLVKKAVSQEVVDLVTQYALFDEKQDLSIEVGDVPQVPGMHSSYGDPMMESLLLKLHSLMEEHTGLTLYPTYSYYRVYRPGSILKIHKDRPSCEISTTLTLGFDYKDLDTNYRWPIFVDSTQCEMNQGDLVIYRGCDLDHWRDEFKAPEGSYHVQVFCHYVDANGPYAEFKYDRRESIGVIPPTIAKNQNIPPKKYISYTR